MTDAYQKNNEEREDEFDLVVIGTGAAASTVAYKCRSAGWNVAVIDSRPFGGTCALRGCDPKKVLVGAAEVIDMNQRMKAKGIKSNGKNAINWRELMRFKRSFTEPVPESSEEAFQKAGIASFHGTASFIDPKTIKVEGNDKSLQARYILIATGAKPVKLKIPGEEYITTSDQFLELDKLPDSIVFVGGGYISFEFAHIVARAGVRKITMVHRGLRPLENFDQDLVNMLVERTRNLGINIMLQTEVTGIEKKKTSSTSKKKFTVKVEAKGDDSDKKKTRSIDADMIVHGAGRAPEIEDLELERGGIEFEKRGITVNEHLQSVSNSSVYAAGDCAASGGLPLTPVASYDGQIVTDNLLKENNSNKVAVDYKGIPSVVFTIPPLASVGLLEEDAQKMGLQFKINHSSTSGWYSSRRINESHSGYKVLVEEHTDRILGAHMFSPHAEEVINIFAMAIKLDLKTTDLKKVLWSYPTNASDINYML